MSLTRRNGGNNQTTRARQARQSNVANGQTAWGYPGHHSWAKSRGGGNKVGATTHAPKEWGSKARKEEEHLTMLAKQAELDAISEGLVEIAEEEYGYEPRVPECCTDDLEEGAAAAGVLLNGMYCWLDEWDLEFNERLNWKED